jgi:hypothetical protein
MTHATACGSLSTTAKRWNRLTSVVPPARATKRHSPAMAAIGGVACSWAKSMTRRSGSRVRRDDQLRTTSFTRAHSWNRCCPGAASRMSA